MTDTKRALKRNEKAFRALLDKHRTGDDWQSQTATLISQTWQRLTTVNGDLLTAISERRAVWERAFNQSGKCPELTGVSEPNANRETVEECPKLTGSANGLENGEMSQINPLSVVLIRDNGSRQKSDLNAGCETVGAALDNSHSETVNSLVAEGPRAVALSPLGEVQQTDATAQRTAGVVASSYAGHGDETKPEPGGIPSTMQTETATQPGRPTAAQLRANPDLLAEVEKDRKRYAKGSKENPFERAAHNLRNDDSNDRNNLARRVRRIVATSAGQPLPLFLPTEVIRLTPDQRAVLDYWQGTRYDLGL